MAHYGQQFRTQANDRVGAVAVAADPELTVKDFSSYYRCGVRGCRNPQYSVTSHATAAAPRAISTSSPLIEDLRTSSANDTNDVDDESAIVYKSNNVDSKSKFELGLNNSFIVVRNTTSSSLCSPSKVKFRQPCSSSSNVCKSLKVTFSNEPPNKDVTKLFPRGSKVGFKIELLPNNISSSSDERASSPAQLVENRSSCLKTCLADRKPVRPNSTDSQAGAEVEVVTRRPSDEKKAEPVEVVNDCRRVLYNEGIDDAAASRASLGARSSTPLLLDRMGSWDWCSRDGVPFTYGHKSRYHRNCLEDSFERYQLDNRSSSRSRCCLEVCRKCSRGVVPLALCRAPAARRSRRRLSSASDSDSTSSPLHYN